jgi:hypothetical protein
LEKGALQQPIEKVCFFSYALSFLFFFLFLLLNSFFVLDFLFFSSFICFILVICLFRIFFFFGFVNVQDIHKPKHFFYKIIIIHFCNLNERKMSDFILFPNLQPWCL